MYCVDSDENMVLSKEASGVKVSYNGERVSGTVASHEIFYTLPFKRKYDQCG